MHSEERGLVRRTEHVREQFIWPMATVASPPMPAGEPMEVDTRPPTETGMVREIFLKGVRSLDLMVCPSSSTMAKWTKLLGPTRARKDIPKDSCESMIVLIYRKRDLHVKTTEEFALIPYC